MCEILVYKCVNKIHLAPTRDVQNNSTSHHPQFEMMNFNLPSYVYYLIPSKVKLQQVKLSHYFIVTSSSSEILYPPPKMTNLQLILHITKYFYLPGVTTFAAKLSPCCNSAYNVCIASTTR